MSDRERTRLRQQYRASCQPPVEGRLLRCVCGRFGRRLAHGRARAMSTRSEPAARAPSPARPSAYSRVAYFAPPAYSSSYAVRRARGTRARETRRKCVRVPPWRYSTFAPTNAAPWSAMALMVASTDRRLVVMPGTSGAMSTPARMPASASARTAFSRCHGERRAGLERRHASSSTDGTLTYTVQHGARRDAPSARRCRARPSAPSSRGRRASAPSQQRLERSPRQLVVAFDRLVGIGGRAERHQLARPRRLAELARAARRASSSSRESRTRTRRLRRARTARGSAGRSSSGSRACSRGTGSASSGTACPRPGSAPSGTVTS